MMMIEQNISSNISVWNFKFDEKQIILFRVWSLSLSERCINCCFGIDAMQKMCNRFSTIFSTMYGGLHEVLHNTLPATFYASKPVL